ncbi:MAG: ankyrin repeat domain-containing protein [Myxococcota bacterium]
MPSYPTHPSLERDRKHAKRLLRKWKDGDRETLERIALHHPRGDHAEPKLANAQLVVAREYGFTSWPRWKAFVELRELDRNGQANALVRAVCSNDVRRGTTLLDADPGLAAHSLAAACACGRPDVVQRWLSRPDADPNAPMGPNAWTPLLYACHSRLLRADPDRIDGIVESARLLIAHGADVNCYFVRTSGEETVPQTAIYGAAGIANHAGLTRLLLHAGADPNEELEEREGHIGVGGEALYHAAEYQDLTCLRLLLEAGPHPTRVSYCLCRMLDFDHPEGAELLLKHGANPNFRIPWQRNRTQLHRAVLFGRQPVTIDALVAAGADLAATDEDGHTALDLARATSRIALEQRLLEYGAPAEQVPSQMLHPTQLSLAAKDDDAATIDRLLDAGANIDTGEDGLPPLHWACWRGRWAAAKRLIERGADIHRRNPYGGDALGTTIHGSANCFDLEGGPGMKLPEEAVLGSYVEIVDLLVSQGAFLPEVVPGGSDAVQEALRRHGVPDPEDSAEA